MFGAAYITIRYEEHKRRETLRELTDRKTNLDDTFQNTESFSIVNDVYVMNKPVRRMDMIEVSDILGPNRVDSTERIVADAVLPHELDQNIPWLTRLWQKMKLNHIMLSIFNLPGDMQNDTHYASKKLCIFFIVVVHSMLIDSIFVSYMQPIRGFNYSDQSSSESQLRFSTVMVTVVTIGTLSKLCDVVIAIIIKYLSDDVSYVSKGEHILRLNSVSELLFAKKLDEDEDDQNIIPTKSIIKNNNDPVFFFDEIYNYGRSESDSQRISEMSESKEAYGKFPGPTSNEIRSTSICDNKLPLTPPAKESFSELAYKQNPLHHRHEDSTEEIVSSKCIISKYCREVCCVNTRPTAVNRMSNRASENGKIGEESNRRLNLQPWGKRLHSGNKRRDSDGKLYSRQDRDHDNNLESADKTPQNILHPVLTGIHSDDTADRTELEKERNQLNTDVVKGNLIRELMQIGNIDERRKYLMKRFLVKMLPIGDLQRLGYAIIMSDGRAYRDEWGESTRKRSTLLIPFLCLYLVGAVVFMLVRGASMDRDYIGLWLTALAIVLAQDLCLATPAVIWIYFLSLNEFLGRRLHEKIDVFQRIYPYFYMELILAQFHDYKEEVVELGVSSKIIVKVMAMIPPVVQFKLCEACIILVIDLFVISLSLV